MATQATSFDKLRDESIIMPGLNRTYAIGDIAYKYRKRENANFAKLLPVMWRDGKWEYTQLGKIVYRELFDYCTLLT